MSFNQEYVKFSIKMTKYQPRKIESKWSKIWERKGIYQPHLKKSERPFFNLMMFPYPSAEGLHVGNVYAFTGSDIYGRVKRMQGNDVFEPIGLDGFGIHSENYALKVNRHPTEQAKISEKHFYRQLHSIGNGFAWQNRLETYDPQYYQWTQWIFIQMFKAGLAYRKKSTVNFCPSCKTVLSDEQVINGACERCRSMVVKKELEQWFFRITKYAERLLNNLKRIDWSEKVKIAQKNWIGKKEGININYPIVDKEGKQVKLDGKSLKISCFTTRPDTNFGATFVVLAPEHKFVEKLLSRNTRCWLGRDLGLGEKKDEIRAYVKQAKKKTAIERVAEGREKTGVFTGFYCLNQLNNIKMPLYISDFVLMEYGTGAVVGVPGHDERDRQFAKQFGLPIIQVVKPSLVFIDKDTGETRQKALERLNLRIQRGEEAYDGPGTLVNSDDWNGWRWPEDAKKIFEFLEKKGWGKRVTTFRLRDWCISRQRYWGPPIPMIYCSECAGKEISWGDAGSGEETPGVGLDSPGVEGLARVEELRKNMPGWFPVSENELPVLLPKVKNWRPEGEGRGPLDKIPEFYKTKCPQCGGPAKRETDVSDTFLDSAWYFLRYPSIETQNSKLKTSRMKQTIRHTGSGRMHSPGVEESRLPWDLQITKKWLPVDMYIGGAEHSVLHLMYSRFLTMVFKDLGFLDFEEPFKKFRAHGLLISEGAKMSKSKGNVVIPDEYIKKYGADTLRMYLMFLGPFSQGGDFRDVGIRGLYRFLERVWRLVIEKPKTKNQKLKTHIKNQKIKDKKEQNLKRLIHQTIKKVTEDIESLKYNTAIAALMEFLNKLQVTSYKLQEHKEAIKTLLLLLAPFAPFITEELWQRVNKKESGRDTPGVGFDSPGVEDFNSIHLQPWPEYDKNLIEEEEATVVIEINGKVRSQIKLKTQNSKLKTEVEKRAKKEPKVQKYLKDKYLKDKKVKRVVFVPGKLISFVTD